MQSLSEQSYEGFSKPEANFFRLPNEWTDITAQITSLAEMKLVEYVLRHTWGYSEYDIVKKITTDEFMHGRKGKDGNRIDHGTGLSNKSVIEGLHKAVQHGLLEVETDYRDKARIKKCYKLKMKTPLQEDHGSYSDVKNVHIGEKNVHSSYVKSSHRSEKETKERYNNVTKQIKKDHSAYFSTRQITTERNIRRRTDLEVLPDPSSPRSEEGRARTRSTPNRG